MKVEVRPIGEDAHDYNVDTVTFINRESYGPADRIGVEEGSDSVLIVNVNAIISVKIER